MGCGASQGAADDVEAMKGPRRPSEVREHQVVTVHSVALYTVNFTSDGTCAVSGGRSGSVKYWDVASGKQIEELKGHCGFVLNSAISRDDALLVTSSDNHRAWIWKLRHGEGGGDGDGRSGTPQPRHISATLEGHRHKVYAVDFSPDSKTIVTGSMDKTLGIWDVETSKRAVTLRGHDDSVFAASFSPSSNDLCVSGGDDKTVRLWDLRSGACTATYVGHTRTVWSAVLSRDGKQLVTAGMDGGARLWDVGSGQTKTVFEGGAQAQPTHAALFSSDEAHVVACGRDQCVRVWGLDGSAVDVLRGHTQFVCGMDLHGERIATCSLDHTVRLWNMPSESASCLDPDCLRLDGLSVATDDSDDPWALDSPAGRRKDVDAPPRGGAGIDNA